MEVTTQGRVVTRAHVVDTPDVDQARLAERLNQGQLTRRYIDIGALDLLVMRANPLTPTVLNLALMAQERGVRVINDPAGIALTRTKTWLASLADVPRPKTLVTTDHNAARALAESLPQGVVMKPAHGSGGRGVQLVRDPNKVPRTMHDVVRSQPGPVVVQEYLPEADLGEKRLFWVDGHIVGGYLRQRAPGAFLHNLQRGGQPQPVGVSDTDRAIVTAITPHLRRSGIVLAGLDIIGGALVECNTLNPGGIHYAESFRTTDGPTIAEETLQIMTRTWNTSEVRHA